MIFEKLQLVKVIITPTGCLLDYLYFQEHYKIIAIDLSKQQALDADPKAMQQIKQQNTTMFFVIEEAQETILDFS